MTILTHRLRTACLHLVLMLSSIVALPIREVAAESIKLGVWKYQTSVDPMTDERSESAAIIFNNGSGDAGPEILMLMCGQGRLFLNFRFSGYLRSGSEATEGSFVSVDYRVNAEPARSSVGTLLGDDGDHMWFLPSEAEEMARGLIGNRLLLKFDDHTGKSALITVPTRGATAQIRKLSCANPLFEERAEPNPSKEEVDGSGSI